MYCTANDDDTKICHLNKSDIWMSRYSGSSLNARFFGNWFSYHHENYYKKDNYTER